MSPRRISGLCAASAVAIAMFGPATAAAQWQDVPSAERVDKTPEAARAIAHLRSKSTRPRRRAHRSPRLNRLPRSRRARRLLSTTTTTTTTTRSSLSAGESLFAGQYLRSPNGMYILIYQQDSNFVIYNRAGRALWHTGTAGRGGNRVTVQSDGNVVMYAADNRPLWNSNTAGGPGRRLTLQDDANAVLYAPDGRGVWGTGSINSTLHVNETLLPGDVLYSPRQGYVLVFQTDQNLVAYNRFGRAIWHTATAGRGGARVVLQGDSNLVMYRQDGSAVWATYTVNSGARYLSVQDDANIVLYRADGHGAWATHALNSLLMAGETLYAGDALYSPDGAYVFRMQGDGNAVLTTRAGGVVWHTNTPGHPGSRLTLQTDGNAVVYNTANRALWSSGTAGKPANRLVVQGDRNLVLYSADNRYWWASHTAAGPAAGQREERAIAWAVSLKGDQSYNNWCGKFVAHAFGASAYGYNTAWDGARTWGMNSGAAPRGTLVFFAPHSDNGNAGHVGISLGDGTMVSAETSGVRVSSYTSGYWSGLYRGWNHAPSSWPGR